ncbi:putative GTP-binding protein [Buchnera aphidicola str. Bp (Baizongia pistaciae)]|uniref:GTPase Der n=1 Tax=Buchnera aphidicola subsp. Baizongia pistaciae (strain Bp) TaxID=224915 RepID=DER_BUCBP|nr:ribosome biogenesis GTPase Der [Buchnera aphidicola]Q89A14.1 RecName: Full=GTPase Der; AltName: Full=GTP-binding protein EngA [Buchnera aphidicola str. Bp (Baizongia pistaciae)]AAO27247.1 putative GTP-binding protein [Buchnera aphidicola str. Bp (Baizongia pistaciae)]
MVITIALIGRTNVGKSTLFNKLTGNRNDALASNHASLTRDRKHGFIIVNNTKIVLIDTPGINEDSKKKISLDKEIFEQVKFSIKQADLVCLVVSARNKLMHKDVEIIEMLRKFQKKIFLLVNKIEGLNFDLVKYEFYTLGLRNMHFISATNGIGIDFLTNNICSFFTSQKNSLYKKNKDFDIIYSITNDKKNCCQNLNKTIKIAIIGKPNVGKSTLINVLLNEKRVIVDSNPGTTRDSNWSLIIRNKINYMFFDTAGIRKKNKISTYIEKISVHKTLKILNLVHVVLLVIDAMDGFSDQDFYLLNLIIKNGCSVIIILNKNDKLSEKMRINVLNSKMLKLISHVKCHFISAKHNMGTSIIFKLINEAFFNSIKKIHTSKITEILKLAITKHQPPIYKRDRIKIKYAHIGKHNPLTIIIHGNKLEKLSNVYKKYLTNFFQSKLNLVGSSIVLYFKSSKNPFIK